MDKKVSVIIPVYNAAKYLETCFASIEGQTLKGIQAIFVDDGSRDESGKMLDAFAEKHKDSNELEVLVKHQENKGAAAARNVGMALATATYVGFLDSDDKADETMFEKLYQCGEETKADVITCGYYRIRYGKTILKNDTRPECFGKSIKEAPQLFYENVPYIWNKLFRQSMLKTHDIRFLEHLKIYEDMVFTYQCFAQAGKIERLPEPLYYYEERSGSLTNVFGKKRFCLFEAFDEILRQYQEKGLWEFCEDQLLYEYQEHFFVVMRQALSLKTLPGKIAFLNQGFAYGKNHFKNWETDTVVFDKLKVSKQQYMDKKYWLFRSIFKAFKGTKK